MKKFLISCLLIAASITPVFAGGTWTTAAIPESVVVQQTSDGGYVLKIVVNSTQYAMVLDLTSCSASMVSIAQATVQNQRQIQIWYNTSNNTVTWSDASGSSYTNTKIQGIAIK